MTLEQRIEIANRMRNKGYNCSQCVAMAFPDIHNLPDEIWQNYQSASEAASVVRVKCAVW